MAAKIHKNRKNTFVLRLLRHFAAIGLYPLSRSPEQVHFAMRGHTADCMTSAGLD